MAQTTSRTGRILGLIIGSALLLTLAGCFRPAGEDAPRTAEGALPELSSSGDGAGVPLSSPVPALTMVSGDGASGSDMAAGDGSVVMSTLVLDAGSALPTALPALGNGISITMIAPGTQFAPPELPLTPGVDTLSGGQTPAGILVTVEFITPFSPLSPITPEPTLNLPTTATPSGLITPTGLPGTGDDDCLYIVQPGDSLYVIARSNEITLQSLRDANPELTGNAPLLQIGQQIKLPCGTPAPAEADTAIPDASVPLNTTPSAPDATPVDGVEYTVRGGDTLYTIATRNGVTVQAIINANTLANPDRLTIGQVLIIPNS